MQLETLKSTIIFHPSKISRSWVSGFNFHQICKLWNISLKKLFCLTPLLGFIRFHVFFHLKQPYVFFISSKSFCTIFMITENSVDTWNIFMTWQVVLVVRNLPANAGDVKKDPGLSPQWEDPLEEETIFYSSFLACRIPGTEEPGRLQSVGSQRLGHNFGDLACMHVCTDFIYLVCLTN